MTGREKLVTFVKSAQKRGRTEITVAKMLGWFAAERREPRLVHAIREALREGRLRTTPDFATAALHAPIWVETLDRDLRPQAGTLTCRAPGKPSDLHDPADFPHSVEALTLFSFGYWGWGNATRELVQGIDAVEASRGFAPPLFADIRFRREARAKGFRGDAFEKTVGSDRYVWLRGLGNEGIQWGGLRLFNPDTVADLIDLASKGASRRRRVIFYCACEYRQRPDGLRCHRDLVANLAESAAKESAAGSRVIEWPGGAPVLFDLPVPDKVIADALRGSATVPLLPEVPLAQFAGLPWGSIAALTSSERTVHAMVGPARYKNGWALPILRRPVLATDTVVDLEACADLVRRDHAWA